MEMELRIMCGQPLLEKAWTFKHAPRAPVPLAPVCSSWAPSPDRLQAYQASAMVPALLARQTSEAGASSQHEDLRPAWGLGQRHGEAPLSRKSLLKV